jgi:hypothetical protein
MTGGYIGEQESGDHQVVIFTFAGKITTAQKDEWNAVVHNFKNRTFRPTGALTGVTIRGESTPPELRPKKSPRK